jgi:TATA-box binding protein (TBP) (component of TFIID and TFIIIB)
MSSLAETVGVDIGPRNAHLHDYLSNEQLVVPVAGELVIQNLVAKAYLSSTLDLVSLQARLGAVYEVRYEPTRFSGALIRYPGEPKRRTFIVFASGAMILTGWTLEASMRADLHEFVQILNGALVPVELSCTRFSIANMVATHALGKPLDIELVARLNNETEAERAKRTRKHAAKAVKLYVPTHTGVDKRGRPREYGCSILLFAKGSVVMCGLQSVDAMRDMDFVVARYLQPFLLTPEVDDDAADDLSMAALGEDNDDSVASLTRMAGAATLSDDDDDGDEE